MIDLTITERRDPTYDAPDDPPAQCEARLSGVYSLRGPDGSIIATSKDLATLWRDGAPIVTLASVGIH